MSLQFLSALQSFIVSFSLLGLWPTISFETLSSASFSAAGICFQPKISTKPTVIRQPSTKLHKDKVSNQLVNIVECLAAKEQLDGTD